VYDPYVRSFAFLALVLTGCALGAEPNPRGQGDAGGGVDAGAPPRIDAGFLFDGGGDLPTDAGPGPSVDAGAPMDAGAAMADAGAPDAGPLCEAEGCDGDDDDCNTRIDEGAACPGPVVQGAPGTAYLLCDEERSWAAARMVCESVGYSLAVIDDATEDALVYGELDARGFADTWIGLNDILTEMSWVWLDGIALGYTHWDDGEPNDGGDGGEDCGVIMTRDGRESEWDDRACDSERPYVCEAPAP